MNQVKNIAVSKIDPNSSVNVRRQGVDSNVETLKASIERYGFWPEHPIVIRPHPNADSEYEYEHVVGQCRLKASVMLGLEEIPAIVVAVISDDEAIQRSWGENEASGELLFSDKSYWVEKIYKKYCGDGNTAGEALTLAAKFLNVTEVTAQRYYSFAVLPKDLKDMVDVGSLPSGTANTIVKNTYQGGDHRKEKVEQGMRDRAGWYINLDNERRKHAEDALKAGGHNASIEQLDEIIDQKITKTGVRVLIPRALHSGLMKWGQKHGLTEESQIIGHMITTAING